MTYALGVDLGTTYTAAAVHRDGRTFPVDLGVRSAAIPSVVFLREDEQILTGEAANRRGATEPGRVAREFKRRVGDTTPILLGGAPYSADALMSKLLRWVVDAVSEREGSRPSRIAVTHPANWGPYKLDLLRQAIARADLDDVITITEPEAAVIYYATLERVEPGAVIAVYDLGGGTFDAAVVRKTESGVELLGTPEGIERLGGIDFDEAVFSHVAASLGGALEQLDPSDPAAMAAVARLRSECTEAKEALSTDTQVSIPVLLPNVATEVRLTRPEFEAMIRPPLTDTLVAVQRALRSAGVTSDQLTSVLLAGGSSRIPLVAELVGGELGRPVAVDAHPKYGVALGAAVVAAGAAAGRAAAEDAARAGVPGGAGGAGAGAGAAAAAAGLGAVAGAEAAAGAPAAGGSAAPADLSSVPAAAEAVIADPNPTTSVPSTGSAPTVPSPPPPPPPATPTAPAAAVPSPPPAPAMAAAATPGGPAPTIPAAPSTAAPPPGPPTAPMGSYPPGGPPPSGRSKRGLVIGLVAVLVLAAAAVGAIVLLSGGDDDNGTTAGGTTTTAAEVTTTAATGVTTAPTPTATTVPPVCPPGDPRLCIEINSIAIDGDSIVVEWTPFNFDPAVDDFHAHFFWNTTQPGEAGTNARDFGLRPGVWELTDQRPFRSEREMLLSAKPAEATEVCVTVANAAHGVVDPTVFQCVALPG